MHDVIPLRMVGLGQSAQIDTITGPIGLVQRLHELGLQPGTDVQVVQQGSPCIIRVAGTRLCFRGNEEANILVRTDGEGKSA